MLCSLLSILWTTLCVGDVSIPTDKLHPVLVYNKLLVTARNLLQVKFISVPSPSFVCLSINSSRL